jgi:hypothetical protein
MANIDFMTVVKWVGRHDDRVLIRTFYGHLADERLKAVAQRLAFVPTVVEKAEAV